MLRLGRWMSPRRPPGCASAQPRAGAVDAPSAREGGEAGSIPTGYNCCESSGGGWPDGSGLVRWAALAGRPARVRRRPAWSPPARHPLLCGLRQHPARGPAEPWPDSGRQTGMAVESDARLQRPFPALLPASRRAARRGRRGAAPCWRAAASLLSERGQSHPTPGLALPTLAAPFRAGGPRPRGASATAAAPSATGVRSCTGTPPGPPSAPRAGRGRSRPPPSLSGGGPGAAWHCAGPPASRATRAAGRAGRRGTNAPVPTPLPPSSRPRGAEGRPAPAPGEQPVPPQRFLLRHRPRRAGARAPQAADPLPGSAARRSPEFTAIGTVGNQASPSRSKTSGRAGATASDVRAGAARHRPSYSNAARRARPSAGAAPGPDRCLSIAEAGGQNCGPRHEGLRSAPLAAGRARHGPGHKQRGADIRPILPPSCRQRLRPVPARLAVLRQPHARPLVILLGQRQACVCLIKQPSLEKSRSRCQHTAAGHC